MMILFAMQSVSGYLTFAIVTFYPMTSLRLKYLIITQLIDCVITRFPVLPGCEFELPYDQFTWERKICNVFPGKINVSLKM